MVSILFVSHKITLDRTFTINCKGNLIDLSTPKVMGILNVTPDSFYDGGVYRSDVAILSQVEKMLSEGATFVDVGAYSSRPRAEYVSEDEELKRIVPIVTLILNNFPEIHLSVDTFRSQVAKQCIEAGSALINDISAGILDPDMLPTIADLQVPYIMMHMRGTPQTMHLNTDYDDLVKDILFYFSERLAAAKSVGIIDLIIDPGFGFAKTIEQNFELLHHLELFKIIDYPLMVGLSRKSMIYKTLGSNAQEALNGTTVLHTIALQKRASILRVHDVRQAVERIKLVEALGNER